ncbi:MAG: winged helix-turn-helix domain-containing protein [Sphingopyxis sp.]|jgi:two-component system, OmpR family, response regulator|uniref:response regulator transcription factor n=1 Tax=Sphingopyxis sp. Root1497 TaxID=1736474 RepID=UPI0006FE5CAB|nr:response regulator transcription factor [Sphingopyxis sp. Root1497]KQZ61301.1 XRE family transcriptional regulator [Sphingopyxis sp. Root1497]
MQILVIEDDARVAEHIGKGLKSAGHVVTHEADGRAGLIRATTDGFDLIIVDRMLPHVDGLTIVQTIRATGDATPILFLSALGEVDERVAGLRAGGDDYLTKPFAMSELLARVDVLARRGPAIVAETKLAVGDLEIDLLGQQVKRQGKAIDLTTREYRILTYLARNEGRVVTRSMLLEHVWDYQFDPQTNIIDQHVSRLRQKVDRGFDAALIHTVRGTGYLMRAG